MSVIVRPWHPRGRCAMEKRKKLNAISYDTILFKFNYELTILCTSRGGGGGPFYPLINEAPTYDFEQPLDYYVGHTSMSNPLQSQQIFR